MKRRSFRFLKYGLPKLWGADEKKHSVCIWTVWGLCSGKEDREERGFFFWNESIIREESQRNYDNHGRIRGRGDDEYFASHPMIFSSIIACLIFDWLHFLMNTWNDFTPIIELTMFLILALSSLSRYTLSPHFQNSMNIHFFAYYALAWCHAWLSWYMLDCLVIFDKNAYCVLYFYTNFDVLW